MFDPATYTESFEREHGCTEVEWLGQLPGACEPHALRVGHAQAWVSLDGGTLQLDWQVLPPRRIALIQLPLMRVRYHFDGVETPARQRFMKHFDLFMQKGGG
ncbi:MAG: hypothetical protein J0M20_12450 [Burkholderiales bacterium]|nr:hypothetical protein [Burkholderiales bacterium]